LADAGVATLSTLIELARRVPKADLHCHLIGTIRAQTASDLARKRGIKFPAEPAFFYSRIDSTPPNISFADTAVRLPALVESSPPGYSLLGVSEWIADVLVDPSDFARVAYEAVQDAFIQSNVRHLELHVEVGAYLQRGISYRTIADGLAQGLEAAAREFGTTARLIAGIDRSKSAALATAVVQEVVDYPTPHVVGIGLDNLETAGPPEQFIDAYELARTHGLRRTAHAGEHDPTARNVLSCLDVLNCQRIDHGYFVLEDADVIRRARDSGVPFTCIFTTSRRSWRPWRRESIRQMAGLGLPIVLASDDPALFPTTLADEYEIAVDVLDADAQLITELALRSLNAAWLDDDAKRAARRQFEAENRDLWRQLGFYEPAGQPPTPPDRQHFTQEGTS